MSGQVIALIEHQ